mgnify:CR=1 FL=1
MIVVHIMIAKTPTQLSRKVKSPLSFTALVFSWLISVLRKMTAETRVELKVEYRENADLEG